MQKPDVLAKPSHNKNIDAIVVSMDLPFSMAKFCTVAGIDNLTVASDFRHKAFAKAYGMLIGNGPLGLCACPFCYQ